MARLILTIVIESDEWYDYEDPVDFLVDVYQSRVPGRIEFQEIEECTDGND